MARRSDIQISAVYIKSARAYLNKQIRTAGGDPRTVNKDTFERTLMETAASFQRLDSLRRMESSADE